MITDYVSTANPYNGRLTRSNALSVSSSLKTMLQDVVDLPMRIDRNTLFTAGLANISAMIGGKFKLDGDEGIRNSITNRRESFSLSQSNSIQNLNESWGDLKRDWIDSLEPQQNHPKYPLYVNIINTGYLTKRGTNFILVSADYGRLVLVFT